MKVNLFLAFLWRRLAFFLQKILLSRWYISWICNGNCFDFADKFSRFEFMQRYFFHSTSYSFYRFDLPSTSTRKGITNHFPSWTCLYLLLSLFDLNCNFFFSFLLWLELLLFLFLSFFIYFHICFLLYNSALFLLCPNTFSSLPQSLIIVHIRHHAFTLSIIKTTLFVLLLPNIFSLFDDDKQFTKRIYAWKEMNIQYYNYHAYK